MDYPEEATFYVRLTLVQPRPGEEQRVHEIMDGMLTWLPSQPGYVRGYKLVSGDPIGRIGRLGVWRSEHDADHAAQTQHALSLRSELLMIVEEEAHAEHGYVAYDPQLAQAAPS